MGVDEPEQMELQWVPARNKWWRCNTGSPGTGTGQNNFSSLDMDEKLSHIADKLNDLEQSYREIMKFGQQMSSLQSKIDKTEQCLVSYLVLQTSSRRRESWFLNVICLPDVMSCGR